MSVLCESEFELKVYIDAFCMKRFESKSDKHNRRKWRKKTWKFQDS